MKRLWKSAGIVTLIGLAIGVAAALIDWLQGDDG